MPIWEAEQDATVLRLRLRRVMNADDVALGWMLRTEQPWASGLLVSRLSGMVAQPVLTVAPVSGRLFPTKRAGTGWLLLL